MKILLFLSLIGVVLGTPCITSDDCKDEPHNFEECIDGECENVTKLRMYLPPCCMICKLCCNPVNDASNTSSPVPVQPVTKPLEPCNNSDDCTDDLEECINGECVDNTELRPALRPSGIDCDKLCPVCCDLPRDAVKKPSSAAPIKPCLSNIDCSDDPAKLVQCVGGECQDVTRSGPKLQNCSVDCPLCCVILPAASKRMSAVQVLTTKPARAIPIKVENDSR